MSLSSRNHNSVKRTLFRKLIRICEKTELMELNVRKPSIARETKRKQFVSQIVKVKRNVVEIEWF